MLNCPLLAVKNQATDHLFLNDEGDFPESRTVIEKGVAWEYANNDDMETVQTTGPLKYGVLIMVRMTIISVIVTQLKGRSGIIRALYIVVHFEILQVG